MRALVAMMSVAVFSSCLGLDLSRATACHDDDDCIEAFVCSEGQCHKPTALIACIAGRAFCDGNTALECGSDGFVTSTTRCTGDDLCIDGTCTAVRDCSHDVGINSASMPCSCFGVTVLERDVSGRNCQCRSNIEAFSCCGDTCNVEQLTPVCSADGRHFVSCFDFRREGCLSLVFNRLCEKWCDDSGGTAQCVDCRSDDDCADPVRQHCAEDSKTCTSRAQWSVTSLDFTDATQTLQRDYSNCYFCDASYLEDASQSVLHFQQGTGYVIYSVYVNNDVSAGVETLTADFTATNISLSVTDASYPSSLQGFYGGSQHQAGTITFAEVDLRDGGRVIASADVTLTKHDDASTSVHMLLEFYAVFP